MFAFICGAKLLLFFKICKFWGKKMLFCLRNSEKSSNFAGFLLGETAPRAIKLKMENGKLKMGN